MNDFNANSLESRLDELRNWLVLLARLHLDVRFRDQGASDIAQEALVDATRYRNKIENLGSDDLENWLRRVVRNKVVDFYRKKRPYVTEADLQRVEADIHDSFLRIDNLIVDSRSSPSEHLAKKEDWLRLADALETIDPRNREVFVLRDFSGWPLKKIAEKHDCTIGVVAGRLRRARDELHRKLEEQP